ncbi:SDR family NAD(P)-dependent oxidoreductase [Paracidobacterium acidisoli]|uniref:SDR family oxidoreductase n=1 Tax=Paracidobacterium acidisoli TaxID=2303751 RepID=A0A372IUV9_9BACT|nr:SDR family oxidoreductase [Paracidobacterium acidisoli]MBT9329872.1 SDR family oxidoreductase [Paracidobacterium acidisoli]
MTHSTAPASSLLLDKTAVITGGASGIGLSIAQLFAASGAHVHIVDRNLQDAAVAAATISAAGGRAEAWSCDVQDHSLVGRVFCEIAAKGRIDILVNNAGIAHVGKLSTTSEEDFDRVIGVNVKGAYNCLHAAIGHMVAQNGGVILNLASIAAIAGIADRFAYSTSKGAILAMTYSVAKDYLPQKIRCNAISPARVHTPFVDGFVAKNYPGREEEMFAKLAESQPIGRMATPDEVARLALYLCSDDASFITGMNYPLDGGYMNLRG